MNILLVYYVLLIVMHKIVIVRQSVCSSANVCFQPVKEIVTEDAAKAVHMDI